jgi:rhodanese-related sulfurtransferase
MDPDLSPQQVAELLNQRSVELIDVRQDYEWEAGRIAGARHVELTELAVQADRMQQDQPVVFYCRSGVRSAMAAEAFAGAGFDAHNMVGGLLAWDSAGLPIEPDGGYVAD